MTDSTETADGGTLTIGVTSQNRRSVTEHPGRCRRFWIYRTHDGRIVDRQLIELSKEQTLHATAPEISAPLQPLDVLLVGDMGPGLSRRLADHGIRAEVTGESEPEVAVAAYLAGRQE